MEYRVLPCNGKKISILGMGSAVIGEQSKKEIIETVRLAAESGVN